MRNRENLLSIIKNQLFYSTDAHLQEEVQHLLVSKDRYSLIEYFKLKQSPKLLNNLPQEELFWFAKAISDIKPDIINISDYFTKHDISVFKNYICEIIDKNQLYILHHAFQLEENQWSCIASVEQIALMRKYNIIRANPNFQRQSRKTGFSIETNEILRQIYVNSNRVQEIKKSIIDKSYNFNTIRLNLMDDGSFKPNISHDGLIILPENGDCIIPDGNHRASACEKAYFDNIELKEQFKNQYFQIAFTFYSARKVKQLISQEWNVQKVPQVHIKSMKINYANEVVDAIKRSDRAERVYADNIVTTGSEVVAGDGFIVYSRLSDAIDRYYGANQFKLKAQALDLADWIIDFYNYLSVLFIDEFTNLKNTRKTKWLINIYSVYGFVYLSYLLKDDEAWKIKLKGIVDNINWDASESPIISVYSDSNIKRVEKFFKEKAGVIDV